jgi:hypothetical protein
LLVEMMVRHSFIASEPRGDICTLHGGPEQSGSIDEIEAQLQRAIEATVATQTAVEEA